MTMTATGAHGDGDRARTPSRDGTERSTRANESAARGACEGDKAPPPVVMGIELGSTSDGDAPLLTHCIQKPEEKREISGRAAAEASDAPATIVDDAPLPLDDFSTSQSSLGVISTVAINDPPNPPVPALAQRDLHDRSTITTSSAPILLEATLVEDGYGLTHEPLQTTAHLSVDATILENTPTAFNNLINPETFAEVDLSTAFSPDGNMNLGAVLRARRELRAVFGWKRDYGKSTSTAEGKRGRAFAEAQAERFAEGCCRSSGCDAAALGRAMAEFDRLRRDFGWRDDYGIFVSTTRAWERREEAERKAESVLLRMAF